MAEATIYRQSNGPWLLTNWLAMNNTFSPASETAKSVTTPWSPGSTSQQPLPSVPSVTSAGSAPLRQKQKGQRQTSASQWGSSAHNWRTTSKKVKRNITGQYIPSAPTGGARDRRSEPRSLPSWSLQAKEYQAKPYPLSLFNCASFLGWCVRVLFVEPSLHLTFISQGKASPERRHFKQARAWWSKSKVSWQT